MRFVKYFFIVIWRDFYYFFKWRLPLRFRLFYPFAKYFALLKYFLFGKKSIYYFGNKFEYDNWTVPFSLQQYPYEIVYEILSNIKDPVNKILDIGGNIGQFSYTAKKILGNSEIDVFEPNPQAYKFLSRNVANLCDVKTFMCGIGDVSSSKKLYFAKDRTAGGSFIQYNAARSRFGDEDVDCLDVKLLNDIGVCTGVESYDLVKIDVEGYEFELLKHIKNVKTRYLWIEIMSEKAADYSHNDLFNLIKEKFGNYEILKAPDNNCDVMCVLISFFK